MRWHFGNGTRTARGWHGEDALRIMRALRFAATYSFTIEPATSAALLHLWGSLSQIAVERIAAELIRLLCGNGVVTVLIDYLQVLGVVILELLPMQGFDQHNPHHSHDLWQHTLHAVEATPQQNTLRLAALLHDVGKLLHSLLQEVLEDRLPNDREQLLAAAARLYDEQGGR